MSTTNKAYINGDFATEVGARDAIQVIAANITLTIADANKTFLIATDALTITLPATLAGLRFKFINTGANGNNIITIAPIAADGIAGTITLASTVVNRAGTVNTALVNTKATTHVGDAIEIIGTGITGVTAWIIQNSTGIWA